MKHIRICANISTYNLSIDEFDNKSIANLAMQHAKNQLELEQLYKVGMKGLEMVKKKFGNDTDKFIRFSMWWVRQSIIKFAIENYRYKSK